MEPGNVVTLQKGRGITLHLHFITCCNLIKISSYILKDNSKSNINCF